MEADPVLTGTDTANEWFELRNVGVAPVTLNGWTITDNTSSDTIPTVTLGVGGHVIVAATPAGFSSEHPTFVGTVLDLGGSIGNGLANGGDVVTLRDNTSAIIDCVSWGTNITCLNPSIGAGPGDSNVTLQRTGLLDTDLAADWTNNTAETPNGTTNYGIVYTWAPPAPGLTGDYQLPANWDPDRLLVNITPADVLVVDGGPTPTTTITNIPTETIAQFRFINATAATLQSSGTNTLTIAGAAGTDFDVSGSSQVKLSGTNTLTVRIGAGATGNIDNLLSFEGTGGSRLIATDTGAVTFPTATNCTALVGYTGNPFGTNALLAGAGSIVFQSGSNYFHNAGDSPFGAAGDSQIVNFQSGSTARWYTNSGFQASGRTYADLEIGNGSTAVSVSDTGTGNFQFENLTVKAAGANNSSLTYTGTGSAAVNISGNISSTGAGTGTAQDINLIAPGGITINKPASSITFGNDLSNSRALNLDGNVTLTNTTTLTLSRIVLLGQVNPNSKTFTVSPTAVLNGGSTGYIVGGLKKNFTGTDLSRTFEIGTTAAYTPINLTFAAVSVAGDITANSFSGDHADTTAGTAGIDKNRSVNNYWNLTQDGTIAFSTYDATFNFTGGLIDGSATPSAFIVRKKDSGVWTSPTVGTKTATSTQATGMATMSDFVIGEAPCVPPATVYVDDDWSSVVPGADPDAGGPATNFGCDSFATIQGGVTNVAASGTVLVYAGTYNEDVTINNAGLQLLGFDPGTKTIIGPSGGPGATIQISSSNVTVAGFTITRAGNAVGTWLDPTLNSTGIAIQGLSITGALIRDNVFTGNRTGIDINNSGGHTVRNNTIDFNRTGMIFRNQTDAMSVVENFITNNWTVGVLFLDASGGTNSPLQQALNSTFSNNDISANWYGQIVDRQSGGSLPAPGTTNVKNFSGNWFGTTAPVITTANSAEPGYDTQIPTAYGGSAAPPGGQPDIAGPASANFDYTPYLDVGTDTNVETVVGRGTNGFQGSFSVLHVIATGAQTGTAGRIQEGIDIVASSTVNVHAGTYDEDININKAGFQLLGAGAGSTSIRGPIGGSGTTVQISANTVTVAGFTITRLGNNTTDWNNPGLNSGGLAIQGLATTGALIRDNIFTGNRTGIDINNSGSHTIRNNTIDFNRTGMIFRNQTDNLTVVENLITNNWTVGIVFLDASTGSNVPVQQALNSAFSNNNLSANWYGQIVERQSGGSLPAPGTTNLKNFSNNWFGTNAPVITTANSAEPGYAAQIPVAYGGTSTPPGGQPDIAGPASANVDYTPYLDVGTDTNVETVVGRGTNGFQGSFGVLHVIATSAQTGAVGRIQEGINSVTSGGTVRIHTGSYTENVDATSNSVVLAPGASPGQVTINGNLTLDGNDTVAIEINGTTPGVDYDQFVVNGQVTLGNATLVMSGTYTPAFIDTFTIIGNDSTDVVNGTFNGLPEGTVLSVNGKNKKITYIGGDGNDVQLLPSNDPPVWITTSATVSEPLGTEANPIQRSATLQVNEGDDGQSLTFSVTGGTGYCGASPTHPFTGFGFSPNPVTAAAGNESTNMTFNVGANDAGTHCVRVTVNDGFGDVTQDITVTVTAANSSPVATNDAYSADENGTLTVIAPGVLGNDNDADTGQTRTAVQVTGPAHASSFTLNPDGSFTYTPVVGYAGPDTFTYLARDNSGDVATQDSNTATVNITVNPTACTPAPTDMVAWWPGDGSARDVQGPTFEHGSLNGTTFAAGKVDQAFSFNGSSDVTVPHNANLNVQTFTLDAWVNPSLLDGHVEIIANKESSDSTAFEYQLAIRGSGDPGQGTIPVGNLIFYIGGISGLPSEYSGWVDGGGSVPLNTWTHVALTFDGTAARTYINGTLARTVGALTGMVSMTTGPFQIGSRPSGPVTTDPNIRFNGLIDEVELFNRALADPEVQAIAAHAGFGKCRTCTAPPANLRNWWDGSGTGTTANDISGPNPGQLQGTAAFGPGKVGQGFVFDGTSGGAVSITYASGFPSSANGFTVDGWIKLDSFDTSDGIFSAVNTAGGGGANDIRVRLMTEQNGAGGNVYAQVRRPTGGVYDVEVSSGPVLTANAWHHVAMTAAPNSQIRIYVDGILVAISGDNVGSSLPTDVNRVFIGSGEQATVFNVDGSIDDVQLFTRVLSAAEIVAIADAGNAGKCHTSTIQFSSPTYTVAENIGSGNATITVTRTGALDNPASVGYATVAGGSATAGTTTCAAGDDYLTTSGTVNFAINDASETFTIPICNDGVFEANETVNLQLSNPSAGSTLGTPSSAVLTITNAEDSPQITIDDVTLAEGDSGTTNFVFTVTKTGNTELTATVNYTTNNITATGGVSCGTGIDYVTTAGTLSFDPNENTKQITVPVCGDIDVEFNELFLVSLSGGTNRVIADFTGDGNIINDDTEVTLTVSPAAVFEDNTPNLVYTFTRNLTTSPLTVNFSIGGTATFGPNPGDDYTQTGATTFTPPSGTVTFAAGSATATVTIDPTLDATSEVDETVVLTIASGAGYVIGSPNQAIGTIRDDDAAPTLLVVRETNLHGWVPTASGTASTSFVIGPGIPPLGEGSGQLSVGTDGNSAAQFRQTGFNGTLLSDLSRLRYSSYTSNDGSVPTTGDQTAYIILNVDLDGNGTNDTLLFFEPEYQHGYTAVVPDQGDNVLNTWQTWDALIGGWWSTTTAAGAGPGANVKPLSTIIAAFPNARIHNHATTGSLRLVAGFGAGSWDNFVGNIDDVNVGVNNVNTRYDFEPLPRISIDNVTAAEGNAGPTTFTFTVSLSGASDQTITVQYTTADNTAKVSDSDYVTKADTLSFAPGETSKTIDVTVNGDTKLEPDETFFVDLASPTNAVILDGRGVGTIQNDDNATSPTFSINNVTMAEGNAGTTNFIFTVTKTGVTGIRSRVDFATADGTTDPATGGGACGGSVDYVSQSGTLAFNPGETTKQITVAVCGETTFEPNETFFVNLSNPVNGSIAPGQGTGTGTITNDDCAAFSTVYVDDDWVGTTFMADPDGIGPATSFGCDSFATIQGGINAVQPGGTVIVAAGTYTENLTLAKQVTLQGAQFGVSACGRSATESTITAASGILLNLQAGSANSIIDGFTFSGGTRGIESTGGPLNNLQIRNNRVLGFTGNGIFLNDPGTDITVHQNSIDGGSKTGSGGLFHLDQDSFLGFHFTNNCITGKGATDTSTGFFVDGNHNVGVSATPRTPLISGNSIVNAQTGMNLGRFAFTGAASTNNGTISNNTFSNNLFDGLQGGIQNTTISGNTFGGNGRHGLALTGFSSPVSVDPTRGAINTLVLSNTITGNGFVNAGAGISFNALQFPGTISTNEAHFNRIVGNATGAIYNGIETINLEKNWWGCNYGPGVGGSGCSGTPNGLGGTGAATLDANPWIVLGVTASPNLVTTGGSSTITADMTDTNAGADNVTTVPLPDAQFTATNGTISPSSDPFTAGLADSTFTSTSSSTGSACATVDGQQTCATISINLPSFSISDASVTEGNAGTANLVFTVTKTGPGAAAVNFQTQDSSATIANNDYQANSGPLVFASSDTTKMITVLVNGDTTPEIHETLNVILSSPTDATISDNTGVGTIFNDDESVSAGQLIISEFRLSGPGANPTAQANNEFIELYNATDQDLLVTTTDGSAGWAVATSSGVEIFNVPNGTTIPARAHFLGTNTTGYSLSTYPAGVGTFATGNATWLTDVPDNTALAVFRTNNNANFNTTNRLDAVGPNTESNTLYREGAGYSPLAPTDLTLNLEHTFFRQICVFQAGCPTPGRPRDTQDNAADFIFADTTGAATSAGQRLGAPGPENLSSPIKRDPAVNLLLLDATVGDAIAPNRDRNTTPDTSNASQFGTMTIRRRVVNQTGGNVTRLRFRIIDMTTHPSGVFADLRLRSSSTQSIGGVNDPNTCASTGTPTTPSCTVNVMALTLEQPPNQEQPNQIPANGGGLNSTVTLPLSSPLLNGQSINVNFLLGVQKTGQFRFYLVIEALP